MLFGLAPHAAAWGQTQGGISDEAAHDTVSWTVSAQDTGDVKPGSRLTLTLHAAVLDGWHVYALKTPAGGPTPLRVTLDRGGVATAAGAPAGSPATKVHDPSFDLDLQYYSHAFTVAVPVRLASHLAAGKQLVPVSVEFQTCNGKVCQPPKTVRLSAPVTVRAGA